MIFQTEKRSTNFYHKFEGAKVYDIYRRRNLDKIKILPKNKTVKMILNAIQYD